MLTVEYNFRSYKAQTTPATLLVSVRDSACKVFSLDALEHTLSYKGKVLDLTLPLRFTSLVSGAKLSIEKLETATKARIKLRLTDRDFVGTFSPTTTVGQVLQAASVNDGTAYLADLKVSNDETLLQLGVNGSAVFSVRPTVNDEGSSKDVKNREISSQEHRIEPENQKEEEAPLLPSRPVSPPLPVRPVQVYKPQEPVEPVEPAEPAEPDKPSIAQLQMYMAHLKSQATPRQMVPKSLQQSMRREKRMQQDITIRIRLPDMSSVEGVFKPTETGEHVFDFVRGLLVNPEITFTLETVPRGYELVQSAHLVDDTDFGPRVLLELKTTSKGPFLNNQALHMSKLKQTQQAEQTERRDTQKDQPRGGPKKVPKWFKLGNK